MNKLLEYCIENYFYFKMNTNKYNFEGRYLEITLTKNGYHHICFMVDLEDSKNESYMAEWCDMVINKSTKYFQDK